jgi:hypothetical protein
MAHFAQIDSNNKVLQVIVINNEDILDENGNESEAVGIQFCKELLGGEWLQTSYNGNFRKNYAGIGSNYDPTRDAFIEDKPFETWILDEELCQYVPPVPYPDVPEGSTEKYEWDEDTAQWIRFDEPLL